MNSGTELTSLTDFAGRVAGSDAERRAAVHLRARLHALDREAELQPIEVRPRFGLTHTLHALLAIVGSVVAVKSAPVGAAIVLLAALSTLLDVTGTVQLVRRLTGRRASQNVESLEDEGKAGVLILVAHYDSPRAARAFARARRLLRDPWLAMLISMLVILACCAARALGLEDSALTAVQFLPTVVLILMTPALADVELSPPAPGEADNAAGVATVLRLAEELGGRLEHFDVWVLLTGAQEPFALGMAGWLRRRRKGLDPERTAVLNVDGIGGGAVRFTRREGPIVPLRAHSELVRICREIAEDDGDGGVYAARAVVSHERSDGAAAIARGLPALTVSCEGDAPDAASLDRAYAFCRELVERLDAEVGPTIAGLAGADADADATGVTGSPPPEPLRPA